MELALNKAVEGYFCGPKHTFKKRTDKGQGMVSGINSNRFGQQPVKL
jgi:hypothetical protein